MEISEIVFSLILGLVGTISLISAWVVKGIKISDEKLKTGIAKVTGALDKVAQLNGVEFTYKKDGSGGS